MIVDERLSGTITAVGTATGDRIVVGAWNRSPLGRIVDVMWALPDGTRRLLAPERRILDYVGGIYDFEDHDVVDVMWQATPRRLELTAGPIRLAVRASGGGRVPVPRPWWFTRWVEGPIARRVMGVETHGTSPRGAEEWYQARAWRWIQSGQVEIDGRDVGPIAAPTPALGVGFSEPPPRPSITDVRVRVRRRL